MVPVRKSPVVPALEEAQDGTLPAAAAPARLRQAGEADAGTPNPALQAQLDRLAEFAAETPEPHVVRYSPRVRLAILAAAAVVPWVVIGLAVKGALAIL